MTLSVCSNWDGVEVDNTNDRVWPILLKNSVLAVNEKTLAPQADLVNLDTWGYRFLS
jgi:hypothetical protein